MRAREALAARAAARFLLLAGLGALAAFLVAGATRAVAAEVSADAHGISVRAKDEPLGDVLAALRKAVRANLMVDAGVEARKVTLDGRYHSAGDAVRAIAGAAGVSAEEAGGVWLVRAPEAKSPRAAPHAPTVTVDAAGIFRASGTIDYPVEVLRDTPEDETRKAEWAGFEGRPGIGLIVSQATREQAVREYLEARAAFKVMLERAGVELDLPLKVEDRDVRVYVEAPKDRLYAELIFASERGGPHVGHLVWVLHARRSKCERLVMFRARVE